MKKFVCLLMVVTMVLALGITVYARYELCPDCEVALVNGSWTEPGQAYCETCRDEYDVTEHYRGEICPDCGEYQSKRLVKVTGSCPDCD